MKKFSCIYMMAAMTALMFVASSCSTKKIVYLQGADRLYHTPQTIDQEFELAIKPDDELAIAVTSKDGELIAPFNNNQLIGSGTGYSVNSGSYSAQANTSAGTCYFLVDKKGNIEFPVFGTINTTGKTCKQLAKELQDRLVSGGHIKDAVVNIKIMSFKVTVLGDVKNPGPQTFTGQRLSLLEAIGKAGDLNGSAQRDHILVVREVDGKRVTYDLDLRDPHSVFDSPAYYLQQNDVVYVQPNQSVRVKGSTGYTILSVGATVVSMVVSVVSLVIAINNMKK